MTCECTEALVVKTASVGPSFMSRPMICVRCGQPLFSDKPAPATPEDGQRPSTPEDGQTVTTR